MQYWTSLSVFSLTAFDSGSVFTGPNVSSAIDGLPEGAAKRALLGMKSFYKAVIKDLQKMMSIEDTLLKALTCLNPKEQKGYNSLQHCRVVAREMPSIQPEEEIIAGDEWIRYQEFEVTYDDLKLRIDKTGTRYSAGEMTVETILWYYQKMVKHALSLCHSNADVERSFSTSKRMLTKQIWP